MTESPTWAMAHVGGLTDYGSGAFELLDGADLGRWAYASAAGCEGIRADAVSGYPPMEVRETSVLVRT